MSMTESEASERIKEDICHGNPKGLCRDACMYGKGKCAYDMAVRALEEVKQYRAIGTVEELQSMKENGAFSALEMAQIVAKLNMLKEYEAIGTVSELQELKEKSTAKKPIPLDKDGEYHECPTCGGYAENNCGCAYRFCPNCGTEFDWSKGKG